MTKGKSLDCLTCGLFDGPANPKIQPHGEGKKKIMIIGEAPGRVEDRNGLPWQGKTGRHLQHTLRRLGINLFEDCVCVNAVNCRPPNNRAPKPVEIDCCREVIVGKALEQYKPRVIILLGTVAVQSFLSPRWKTDLGGIAKWRGWRIPDRDFKAWVVPTFHPSYVVRMDSREVQTIWEQDLSLAVEAAGMHFPKFPTPDISFIDDLSVLTEHKVSEISFDYETTGLKSNMRGQRIVCASVAVDERRTYAFMMPNTKVERQPFVDLLTNTTIGKMAHNMKFEQKWTKDRLRTDIENWQWDSMIAAHILDNRSGVTGLKFQTYVRFGVVDYASEITPYLRGKDGTGFNKVMELVETTEGREKLLQYCALDSHYEYLLAQLQMKELGYEYLPF